MRVPRDRDGGDRVALALGPLRLAGGREIAQLPTQQRHLGADATAIELDLRLTRSARSHARAARADLTTGLATHRVTPTAQSRQEVLELRQFDLGLALAALRVLAEDVEDDRGPVDDLDLHDIFERAPLAGRKLGVGDDGIGADGGDKVAQLRRLAAPDVGRRIGMRAPLQHAVEDDRTGRLGERSELAQAVLGILLRALRIDADEHDVLEPQLPILDLGDVFEFGREPRHASQRRALLAIPLIAVRVGVHDRRGILQRLRGPEDMDAGARRRARKHPIDGVDGVCEIRVTGGAGGVCHSFLFLLSLVV